MIKKLIPILLMVVAFSGCKMKYTFTGASIPAGTETVSIANFPNMAPLVNPTLSMTLTESLKDKFMSQTSLQLVQRDGDLQFSGTITGYSTRPVAIQAGDTDVAAMNRLTISVKVKFVNTLDSEADFDTSFSHFSDYDSSRNLQDVEDGLIDEILEKIIDDIFNKSVVNW